jgi:hypothetical protein
VLGVADYILSPIEAAEDLGALIGETHQHTGHTRDGIISHSFRARGCILPHKTHRVVLITMMLTANGRMTMMSRESH